MVCISVPNRRVGCESGHVTDFNGYEANVTTTQPVGLTQEELASKAGVGLRFVRDLEQGKKTLRLDKVNQVLSLFGKEVGVVDFKS